MVNYEVPNYQRPEVSQITDWLKRRNIKLFLFDLDDTLIETREIFVDQLEKCYDFLSQNVSHLTRDKMKEVIRATNDRAYEKYGVNPNRWAHVMQEFSANNPQIKPEVITEGLKIINGIYTAVPKYKDGALDLLSNLRNANCPIGIVTHANIPWTKFKYDVLRLDRFLDWNDVFVVNENGLKTEVEWSQAFWYFSLNYDTLLTPDNIAVVGDSVRSDILPAHLNHIKTKIWIKNDARWSVQEAETPEGTIIIPHLSKLFS